MLLIFSMLTLQNISAQNQTTNNEPAVTLTPSRVTDDGLVLMKIENVRAANEIFVEHKYFKNKLILQDAEIDNLVEQTENLQEQIENQKQITKLQTEITDTVKKQNKQLKYGTSALIVISLLFGAIAIGK